MTPNEPRVTRYPLTWPEQWPRTPGSEKKNGHFKTYGSKASVSVGVDRVIAELERMGVSGDDLIISTNVPTRLDGTPRSDQAKPVDSGVAVYWRSGPNEPMKSMAIDIYYRVSENLCAIAAVLEALRAVERHGGKQIEERAFKGFAALPASTHDDWTDVLLIFKPKEEITREDIDIQFKKYAKERHPDRLGGSDERMDELNRAREEAYRWLEGK